MLRAPVCAGKCSNLLANDRIVSMQTLGVVHAEDEACTASTGSTLGPVELARLVTEPAALSCREAGHSPSSLHA